MTTGQLKEFLLSEHKRDLRLTYVQYAIWGIIVLLLIGLISYLIISSGGSITRTVSAFFGESADSFESNKYTMYYKIIIPVALILSLGYPLYDLIKRIKRPQQIDNFLRLLENGSKVISINSTKDYKVYLPLGIANIKMSPVSTLHIVMQGSSKMFVFPVPESYIGDIKDLLNENS